MSAKQHARRYNKLWTAVGLPVAFILAGCSYDYPSRADDYDRYGMQPAVTYAPAPPVETDYQEARYEPASPAVVVEYQRDLDPYGQWVQTPQYGRCWAPSDRPADWQPYTVGHWEDTDRGWCWASEGGEADWGLVTYHYGRWYRERSFGWVWIPGSVWAPAWVAWRGGDGYCGWYPLPPQCGEGVDVEPVIVERYCPADRFVYCDERYLAEPAVYRHVEYHNTRIINRTTNITNITYVNNRIINRGVDAREVEQRSGRRVERAQLAETSSVSEAQLLHQQGRPVVYAPTAVRDAERANSEKLQRAMARHGSLVERPGGQRQQSPRDAAQTDVRESGRPAAQGRIELQDDPQRGAQSQQAARRPRGADANDAVPTADRERADQQAAAQRRADERRQAEPAAGQQRTVRDQQRQPVREDPANERKAAEGERAAQAEQQREARQQQRQAARDDAAADKAAAERERAAQAEQQRAARQQQRQSDRDNAAAERERGAQAEQQRAAREQQQRQASDNAAVADRAAAERDRAAQQRQAERDAAAQRQQNADRDQHAQGGQTRSGQDKSRRNPSDPNQ